MRGTYRKHRMGKKSTDGEFEGKEQMQHNFEALLPKAVERKKNTMNEAQEKIQIHGERERFATSTVKGH